MTNSNKPDHIILALAIMERAFPNHFCQFFTTFLGKRLTPISNHWKNRHFGIFLIKNRIIPNTVFSRQKCTENDEFLKIFGQLKSGGKPRLTMVYVVVYVGIFNWRKGKALWRKQDRPLYLPSPLPTQTRRPKPKTLLKF